MTEILRQGVQTRNLPQYRKLHSRRRYGTTADKRLKWVLPHVKKLSPNSILDYGCGTSHLGDKLAAAVDAKSFRFDPGIPEWSEIPEEALQGVDLVICCHVLEHLDPPEVEKVLQQLAALSQNVYLEVPTAPAKTKLPNGENAHSLVKPKSWWMDLFSQHFDSVHEVPTRWDDNLGVATFSPAEGPSAEGTSPSGRSRPKRRRSPRSRVRRKVVRSRQKPPVTQRPLRKKAPPSLEGKVVAVVGRAKSLIGSGEGARIDACDVVIRVNQKLPLDPKLAADIGTRTDIVYTCQAAKGARVEAQRRGVAVNRHNKKLRKKLSEPNGYSPFTGTVAIFDAIARGAKEVFATGMDLYSGPATTRHGGQLKMSTKCGYKYHDPNQDKELLVELQSSKPGVLSVGAALQKALDSEKIEHFKGLKVPA